MNLPNDPNLIRAYADGELSAEDAAMFEARLASEPALRDRVAFERALRQRISAIAQDAAPQELRDRIVASLASKPAQVPPLDQSDKRPATVGGSPQPGFWNRSRMNIFAVAACLALVSGAVLIGIFYPNIDRQIQQAHQNAAARLVEDAAVHASREHTTCVAQANYRQAKLRFNAPGTIPEQLSDHLGVPLQAIAIPDLSTLGYAVAGAGPCALPGPAPSAHLMYTNDATGEMLSFFLARDERQFDGPEGPLARGVWRADTHHQVEQQPGQPVLRTTDGALVWFLCSSSDDSLEAVKAVVSDAIAARSSR